jgi:hypothetical protein
MSNDLIGRLEQVAQEKNVSFSQLVIQCCEYALGQLGDDITPQSQNNFSSN